MGGGRRLGDALRDTVERRSAADVIVPQWEALFDEVIAEAEVARTFP